MRPVIARRNRNCIISCLCIWPELLFSFLSSRQTAQQESGVRRTSEEQCRLLPGAPRQPESTGGMNEFEQKEQFDIAGIPKFPDVDTESVPKPMSTVSLSDLEDDSCPICFEYYTEDNPKIVMECGHHFHLGCIYAWQERANTCPVCFRPMKFDELQ
eukprot:g4068.t1